MNIKLVAFGIAKDILNGPDKNFQLDEGTTIGALKKSLVAHYPEFEKLRSLRFAINEDYQEDDYELSADDEVVIIPPVSGG